MLEAVIFYLFAIATVVSGLVVITRSNPIESAVALVVTFFFLSGLYVLMDAHFVALIQILVYAGAIMVLFIFVIMLLNLRVEGVPRLGDLQMRGLVGVGVAGLVGLGVMVGLEAATGSALQAVPAAYGTIETVGTAIFSGRFLLPFEVASALLTVAMIGAVILAKREI